MKAFYAADRSATEASLAPLPPNLAAFLESARPTLDSVRARLAQGPPPVWKRDLGAGFETKIRRSEELPQSDVRTFDPETFDREQRASIPRWQFVARLLLPNFWDLWPRSAHFELEAELTALVLEERERVATGGPPRATDRRPSRIKGLSWIYEDIPGRTVVHLDGELRSKEERPVPLRFTVRRRAGAIP